MSIHTAAKPHRLCPVLWISLAASCAPLQGTAGYRAEMEAQSQATPEPTNTIGNSSAPDKQGTFPSEEELELRRNTYSCNKGDAAACFHASFANGRGIAPDDARAVAFLVKACDGGYTPAYSVLADRLAHGKGVSRNEAQAVDLYAKSCESGEGRSCFYAGALINEGRGVTKDEERAFSFFRRACERGDGEACFLMHTRGCAAGESTSCYQLALAYHDGRDVVRDKDRAVDLYARACKGGVSAACTPEKFRAHYEKIVKGIAVGGLASCRENSVPEDLRMTLAIARKLIDELKTPMNYEASAEELPRMVSPRLTKISSETGEAWIREADKLVTAPATYVVEIRNEVPAVEISQEPTTGNTTWGRFKPGSLTARLVRFDSKARPTCATQVTLKNGFLRYDSSDDVVQAARKQLLAEVPDSFGLEWR